VTNLARPGGNLSGFWSFEPDMGGKWLSVLKETAANMRRVAVLFGSDTPIDLAMMRSAEAVARSLGITIAGVDILDGKIERAIADFGKEPDGGLIVLPHRDTLANRGPIIQLAAENRLPTVYPFRSFAAEGGLLAYGPDQNDQWRGVATYVDRILKGEKPADLPVQAPTKYELAINLKTAKGDRALRATGVTCACRRGDRISLLSLLRCMSPKMARNGPVGPVLRCPLIGVDRK
jgi:putative tryptophan/tyrosine transport system substrate-binding protein